MDKCKALEKANRIINNKTIGEMERIVKCLINSKDEYQLLIADKIKEHININKPEENYSFDIKVAEYWIVLKKSSLKRNKEFNLEFNDVKELMLEEKCAYTNTDLINETRTTDRLDNNKGYVKGNVFAVSKRANQLKNILFEDESSKMRMSVDELTHFAKIMKRDM